VPANKLGHGRDAAGLEEGDRAGLGIGGRELVFLELGDDVVGFLC